MITVAAVAAQLWRSCGTALIMDLLMFKHGHGIFDWEKDIVSIQQVCEIFLCTNSKLARLRTLLDYSSLIEQADADMPHLIHHMHTRYGLPQSSKEPASELVILRVAGYDLSPVPPYP